MDRHIGTTNTPFVIFMSVNLQGAMFQDFMFMVPCIADLY